MRRVVLVTPDAKSDLAQMPGWQATSITSGLPLEVVRPDRSLRRRVTGPTRPHKHVFETLGSR